MLLVKNLNDYNLKHIYYSNKLNNKIIHNSSFQILFFSNNMFSTQGIFFKINFINVNVIKYYKKYKCFFERKSNERIIKDIERLEYNILQKNNSTKKKNLKLKTQINKGYFKTHNSEKIDEKKSKCYILKISGVWTTETEIGLTYRFFLFNH